jgi:hypothetical protein
MTDHDQQKLIEVDANLPAKAVFKVSIPGIVPIRVYLSVFPRGPSLESHL